MVRITDYLKDLADLIVARRHYILYRETEWGRVTGDIWWNGKEFEVLAEVEAFGRFYPATWRYPSEQVTNPVGSLSFTTHKIREIDRRLSEFYFEL